MSNLPNFFRNARQIGRGAFGVVFFATNTRANRQTAVKRIHCDDPTAQREIEALTKLIPGGHESIVTFHDAMSYQGSILLEMEYCEEGSLNDFYSRNRGTAVINPSLIFEFFKETMSGLQHLHSIRLAHRDLKPDNILISSGRGGGFHAKITDFGLAKVITDRVCNGTIQNYYMKSGVGTLYFMAPEIILRRQYTVKIDIYSIGMIFTALIIGAFIPDFGLHIGVKHKNIPKPLGVMQSVNPSYEYPLPTDFPASTRMKVLVRSMMAADHHNRPSAKDVVHILEGMNPRDDIQSHGQGASPYQEYQYREGWLEWITGAAVVGFILAILWAILKK